jgi:predicted cupin superfamily sugar epimerase
MVGGAPDAAAVIRLLDLQPHPAEGGFFVETFRSDETLPATALPGRYGGPRAHGTAIYYLLKDDNVSAMHRLASDEVFHFYLGDAVEMLHLFADGNAATVVLGADLEAGERPQVVVPRGTWQGARLRPGGRFALMGTTVAPGFDFADFELGGRDALTAAYPTQSEMIAALTPAAAPS